MLEKRIIEVKQLIGTLKRRFKKDKWKWGDETTNIKSPNTDDGKTYQSVTELLRDEEREEATEFQEKFFEHEIIRE